MEQLFDPQIWIGLATLTALEIVLGIDNIVFITILAGKLPAEKQPRARRLGLAMAVLTRVALLLSLSWLIGLTEPLVTMLGFALSGRDMILVGGGLFLIGKSTFEIHDKLEGPGHGEGGAAAGTATMASVVVQIMLLDMVFSLDSVITAVGMVDELWVMITAVVIAIGIMLVFAEAIADFVGDHPTIKMLALSFLLMIGFTLVVEGLHVHVPKGYIYFAMGFSLFVELLNLRMRSRRERVKLHGGPAGGDG